MLWIGFDLNTLNAAPFGLDDLIAQIDQIENTTDQTLEFPQSEGLNAEVVEFIKTLAFVDDGVGVDDVTDAVEGYLDDVNKAKAEISKLLKNGDALETIFESLGSFPNSVIRGMAKAAQRAEGVFDRVLATIETILNTTSTVLTPINSAKQAMNLCRGS